jgi:2,3-bisphosphoglycerate-independent phosphoglycerate mutase
MKGFVLFADGFAEDHTIPQQTALERSTKPNIDRITELGCSGVLHLRNKNTTDVNQISVEEFEQLLGIYGNISLPEKLENSFHKLKLGIVTNNSHLHDTLCKNHGVSEKDAIQVEITHANTKSENTLVDQVSKQIEQLFNDHDLVFLHLSLHAFVGIEEDENYSTLREYGISFLDQILSKVPQNYFISVAMTHGGPLTSIQLEKENEKAKQFAEKQNPSQGFPLPLQSFQILAGERVDVRFLYPIIASYYHETDTRQDNSKRFTERECEQGANMSILADHFLPEIAYKLGYASKYGA